MSADLAAGGAIVLLQYPGLRGGATLSPPCGKVHMALRCKGIRYEVRNLNSPQQVRRHNPRGRVPVLLAGDETIPDSTDIVSYLDARFPEPPLEPRTGADRARAHVFEDWADEALYFLGLWYRWIDPANLARMHDEVLSRLPRPYRWIVPAVAERTIRRRAVSQGVGTKDGDSVRREFARSLECVEALLAERPWLAGDRLSRGDLAVAAVLDQLRLRALTPDAADSIERFPGISDWLDRVHAVAPDAAAPPAVRSNA